MSPATEKQMQFISDERGEVTGVIVPITAWREIESELETRHLLASPAMRERLLEAKNRSDGIPLEEVLQKLGLK